MQNTDKSLPKRSNKKSDNQTINTKVSKRNIFGYNPFNENGVLQISATMETTLLLLKNGTVVSWGKNSSTLGRRCKDANVDSYLSYPIKFSTKIIDIACGRRHCLARGIDYKVYSWGFNEYGQVCIMPNTYKYS